MVRLDYLEEPFDRSIPIASSNLALLEELTSLEIVDRSFIYYIFFSGLTKRAIHILYSIY
jgi:hypothetical protein